MFTEAFSSSETTNVSGLLLRGKGVKERGSEGSESDFLLKLKFFWRSCAGFAIGGAPSGVDKDEKSTLKFALCNCSERIASLTFC